MNGKQCKSLRASVDRDPVNGYDRQAYRAAKRAYTSGPTSAAQQPKVAASRGSARRRPQPIAPTWPHTYDQHGQSRPVILVRRYLPGQNHKLLEV